MTEINVKKCPSRKKMFKYKKELDGQINIFKGEFGYIKEDKGRRIIENPNPNHLAEDMTSYQRFINLRKHSLNEIYFRHHPGNLTTLISDKGREEQIRRINISPLRFKVSKTEPLMQRKISVPLRMSAIQDLLNDGPEQIQLIPKNPRLGKVFEQSSLTPKFEKSGIKTYFEAYKKSDPIKQGVDYRLLNKASTPSPQRIKKYEGQRESFFKDGFSVFMNPPNVSPSKYSGMQKSSINDIMHGEITQINPVRGPSKDFLGTQINRVLKPCDNNDETPRKSRRTYQQNALKSNLNLFEYNENKPELSRSPQKQQKIFVQFIYQFHCQK